MPAQALVYWCFKNRVFLSVRLFSDSAGAVVCQIAIAMMPETDYQADIVRKQWRVKIARNG